MVGKKFTLILLFGIFLIASVSAAIEINDCVELQAIGSHDASVQWDYFLGNDVDCSATSGWNGGKGFTPLQISGTLDGKGHTISNLYINRPTENAGLFGKIGSLDDGYHLYIKNLKLTNVDITGGGDCRWYGTGGLVGHNSGERVDIINSYVEGDISGDCNVGGLVGIIRMGSEEGWVHISDSHFEGNINSGDTAGGLIGLNEGWSTEFMTDTIIRSYFDGTINSGGMVGGLVGWGKNTVRISIDNSYAKGILTNNNGGNTGGLVGASDPSNLNIRDSYFSGTISTTGTSGGILGINPYLTGVSIRYSYWNSDLYFGYQCGIEVPGYPCGDNTHGVDTISMKGPPKNPPSDPWPWVYRYWDTNVWEFEDPTINEGYAHIKPLCGDGSCEPDDGEDCSTCPTDCGACPYCGDSNCDAGEGCSSCATDCGCEAPIEYYSCKDSDTNALRRKTPSCNTATDNCDNTYTILSTTECTGTTPFCKDKAQDCVQCLVSTHCGTDGFTGITKCTGDIYEKEETQYSCTDNICSSSDNWVQEDCVAISKVCNPTLGCIDPIFLFWQDLSGNIINKSEMGDTVKMVYLNGQNSTDLNFTIWEDDTIWDGWNSGDEDVAEIAGTIQPPNMVGYWTIIKENFIETADDYENFRFSINGNDSQDLEIIIIEKSDSPITITDTFPPCGYNATTGTEIPISFNVSDNDDFVEGGVLVNGTSIYNFSKSPNTIHTFNYTFNKSGTQTITFHAKNTKEEIVILSNIIIVNESEDGNYIASCIKSPKDFQHINTSSIAFDASTTRALNYTLSNKYQNISFDNLIFKWTFSDGSIHPNQDGANSISYKFVKTIKTYGLNSVTLNVELK